METIIVEFIFATLTFSAATFCFFVPDAKPATERRQTVCEMMNLGRRSTDKVSK